MNPLERALARRRVLGARLSIVALVLLVGSSGVVVPKLDGQRRARAQLLAELQTYESTLQLVADLRAYERDGVRVLDQARAELATYVPAPPSRSELRSTLIDGAKRAGIDDVSVEISTLEPFSLEELGEGEEAPLQTTTVVMSGKSDFDRIVRFLHTLANPRPLVIVRQAAFERETAEEDDGEFGRVSFSLRLALVHSPVEPVEPVEESKIAGDTTEAVDSDQEDH